MSKLPSLEVARFVSPAKDLPKFQLQQNDKPFNNQSLKNKWSIMFFGYARCPDVCPTELMFLNNISENIKIKMPDVYFVSVDASRDTPDMLNKFTAYFNKNFIGIGGKQTESDKLSSFMNVIYERVYHKDGKQVIIKKNATVPDELKDSYLINHSADIYLINPEGKLHAVFPLPHKLDSFISDITRVVNNYK